MKIRITIGFIFMFFAVACSHSQKGQGVVTEHTFFYGSDGSLNKPTHLEVKVYFNGKDLIEEVPRFDFGGDSLTFKSEINLSHFSYLNTEENVCYHYRNFSDTAKPFQKYNSVDSVTLDGGWNYFANTSIGYNNSTKIGDTTVNNIHYGRVLLDRVDGVSFILYCRDDLDAPLVQLFKPLGDSINCPIVRVETYIKNRLFMAREFEFVSNKLSPSEIKVFQAWRPKKSK